MRGTCGRLAAHTCPNEMPECADGEPSRVRSAELRRRRAFIHSVLPSAYGSTVRCCVRVALRPLTSKQCRTARLGSRLPSVYTFALRPSLPATATAASVAAERLQCGCTADTDTGSTRADTGSTRGTRRGYTCRATDYMQYSVRLTRAAHHTPLQRMPQHCERHRQLLHGMYCRYCAAL